MTGKSKNNILKILDDKITDLKVILNETMEKHSDAAYDLKDLRDSLYDLENKKNDIVSNQMLVMELEDKK